MLHFASEQEHCSVADRKPTHEAPAQEEQEAEAKFYAANMPPVYFESGIHRLAAISAVGDSLEIEDGSVWKISSYDAHKIGNWSSDDVILITQNHRWFSKYNYKIVNRTINSSVEANLYLGPLKEGMFTRYVVALDAYRGELILNDNTRWRVSAYDSISFQDWILHDAIIVGYNSGWDSESQGLLINVNLNTSVRAEQF